MSERDYHVLSLENKVRLVSGILDTEVVEPVLKVWHVYTQAAEQPKCAVKFLCEINSKERKSEAKKWVLLMSKSHVNCNIFIF